MKTSLVLTARHLLLYILKHLIKRPCTLTPLYDVGQGSVGYEVLKWDANKSITVSGNTAEGRQARGGALHAKSYGTISNTTETVSFNNDGTITISNSKLIPEPTTATLSLLALAALAARRRRK